MNELGDEVLDGYGGTVEIDKIKVRSVGLTGRITVKTLSNASVRGEGLDSEELDKAFSEHRLDIDYVVELNELSTVRVAAGASTRSAKLGEAAIELEVPNVGQGWAQAALLTDENGVASWHFPLLDDDQIDTTRSGKTVTFVFPGYVAESQDEGSTRGVLGWLGKKVIRFVSFAIADAVIGEVGEFFARKWEDRKRPYAIRSFTPDNYTDLTGASISGDDWSKLSEGRALLFVHGTFSRASTGFGGLPKKSMERLHQKYEGRVFAFDHPTLATSPLENAQWIIDQIPDGLELNLDIVCHSRGGLVSRMLSENQQYLDIGTRKLNIQKILFVASPNAGTVLADPKHMGDFVDSYTNILKWIPDNAVTDTLDAIITVVKQISVGVLRGLEGLQSMNPSGHFVNQVLNIGPEANTQYYAIASDFDPTSEGMGEWAKDRIMDKVFQEANDLVVPTAGVYGANNDKMFPITELLQLGHQDGVTHGSFFSNAKVAQTIEKWL